MLYFIELDESSQEGRVIGVDKGLVPDYTFWFDKQSVHIGNYLRLLYLSPTKSITISIETPYTLWDAPDYDKENKVLKTTKHSYDPGITIYDLETKSSLTTISNNIYNYNNNTYYIVPIYIILNNVSMPGQYKSTLTLGDETVQIGAIVETENEILQAAMINKGFEPSNLITKAIYDCDIYEDNPDHAVLNDKLREIAIAYMDILGSKGSSKSLSNSFKWFNYGDLARITESWRSHRTGKLISREVNNWLYENYKALAKSADKTSLLNLELDSTKIPNPTSNPLDYSAAELRLKMYMLGQFFEKYFLPIHLSIYSSHVNNKTEETKKLVSYTANTDGTRPVLQPSYPFYMSWSDTTGSETKTLDITGGPGGMSQEITCELGQVVQAVNGLAYSDVSDSWLETIVDSNSNKKIDKIAHRVHTLDGSVNNIKTTNYYRGIGVILTACIKIPNSRTELDALTDNSSATGAETYKYLSQVTLRYTGPDVYNSNGVDISSVTNLSTPGIHKSNINMQFLFRKPGVHHLKFTFNTTLYENGGFTAGPSYIKEVTVNVIDALVPEMIFKKICVDWTKYKYQTNYTDIQQTDGLSYNIDDTQVPLSYIFTKRKDIGDDPKTTADESEGLEILTHYIPCSDPINLYEYNNPSFKISNTSIVNSRGVLKMHYTDALKKSDFVASSGFSGVQGSMPCPTGGTATLCTARDMVISAGNSVDMSNSAAAMEFFTVEATVRIDPRNKRARRLDLGFWILSWNNNSYVTNYTYVDEETQKTITDYNKRNVKSAEGTRAYAAWSFTRGFSIDKKTNKLKIDDIGDYAGQAKILADLGNDWYRIQYSTRRYPFMASIGIYICNHGKDWGDTTKLQEGAWWVGDISFYTGTTPLTTTVVNNGYSQNIFVPQYHKIVDINKEDRAYKLSDNDVIMALPCFRTQANERVLFNMAEIDSNNTQWRIIRCSDNTDVTDSFPSLQDALFMVQSTSNKCHGKYKIIYNYKFGSEDGAVDCITPFAYQ